MILDNVNPNDLFPTEKKGPSVLGIIEYQVQGENEFEGAPSLIDEKPLFFNLLLLHNAISFSIFKPSFILNIFLNQAYLNQFLQLLSLPQRSLSLKWLMQLQLLHLYLVSVHQ